MNEHHPEIKKIQIKINQLESALQEMKNGDDFEKSSLVLFPSFSIAPELGVQLIRLTREMEIQNALYEFLTQQYEQAKIQEAKDTPTIQVLDYASPPEFRSKPIRSLMVIFSGFASILFSLLVIAFLEYAIKVFNGGYVKYLMRNFAVVIIQYEDKKNKLFISDQICALV